MLLKHRYKDIYSFKISIIVGEWCTKKLFCHGKRTFRNIRAMLSLFTYRIILVFIIVIPEIAFLIEPDKLHKSEIKEGVFQWKMIKDFGQKYGAKYWVLHHTATDDSSWKRWWYFFMKDKTLISYLLSNLNS